jgi:hypothetical protein
MKPLKLRAHGKFSIEKIDNLLIVHAEGPGNIELAENYHQQMSKYVTDLAGKPWGSVNVFSQESFFTPDASENLIAGAKYAKKIGFVACAFVIKADEFKNSLKSFWEMIYRSANVEHRFFESEEEAKVWLIEKLSEYE